MTRSAMTSPKTCALYMVSCMLTHYTLQDRRYSGGIEQYNPSVYVYEFSHPTVMPGLPACDGLACHTAELAFVFEQHEVSISINIIIIF
jgi:carboxylesterase type B